MFISVVFSVCMLPCYQAVSGSAEQIGHFRDQILSELAKKPVAVVLNDHQRGVREKVNRFYDDAEAKAQPGLRKNGDFVRVRGAARPELVVFSHRLRALLAALESPTTQRDLIERGFPREDLEVLMKARLRVSFEVDDPEYRARIAEHPLGFLSDPTADALARVTDRQIADYVFFTWRLLEDIQHERTVETFQQLQPHAQRVLLSYLIERGQNAMTNHRITASESVAAAFRAEHGAGGKEGGQ